MNARERKEELMDKYMSNELEPQDLIDMIVGLEEKIHSAIELTSLDWAPQESQLQVIRETLEGKPQIINLHMRLQKEVFEIINGGINYENFYHGKTI